MLFRFASLLLLPLLALAVPAWSAPAKNKVKAKVKAVRKPSTAGKPNVVFIIADDLRDWIGWMEGNPQARTPNMDRLAKLGLRFTNAHCNFPLCNPSRTSLLTGTLPSSSGVFGNEQDWRRSIQLQGKPTLPEYFRAQGYITAAGGKIFHANHGGPENRLAGWHGGRRGFEQDAAWDQRFPAPGVQIPMLPVPVGQNFNGLNIWHWDWSPLALPDQLTDDGAVVDWTHNFLSEKQDKAFFLAVGLYRPHSPWYVPKAYFDQFPLADIKLPETKPDDLADVPDFAKQHLKDGLDKKLQDKGKAKEAVQAYLASIAFCDAMVGRILDALEKGPNAKNTILVFTSDHGWFLGEKQQWHKGKLWEEGTRIPLVIVAPGITKEDTVTTQPVSLVDLYPTLCDLAKLTKPEHLDGTTLLPLLRDPKAKRATPAITTMGGGDKASYSARSERWRYTRYADGSEELYDHDADPHEWINLADKKEHESVKKDLAAFFPKEFKSASRPASEIAFSPSPDGNIELFLQPGDELSAKDMPDINNHGLFIDASFEYNPEVDQDSTLLAHGDTKLGYVLHLVGGRPTFTLYRDGKPLAISSYPLVAGPTLLRVVLDGDGVFSMATPKHSEIFQEAPFPGGFPGTPAKGLKVCQSFGILSHKDYPNSTPFDGKIQRLRLTLLPTGKSKP